MRVKLVAVDLDGTVLTGSGAVSRATRAALRLAAQQGATVSVATGRSPVGAQLFARRLGAKGPLICLDGALVLDGGRCLADLPMDPGAASASAALACGLGGGWIGLTARGRVHGGPSRRPPQATLGRVLRHPMRSLRFWGTVRREEARWSAELPDDPVYKLLLWAPAGAPRAALLQGLGELPVRIPSAPVSTVEVIAPHVNKGAALRTVVAHLGLSPEEVVAFGDGLNDVEMLAYAGHGVAMGGAPAELLAVAAAQTESVERDGVARELRRLLGA